MLFMGAAGLEKLDESDACFRFDSWNQLGIPLAIEFKLQADDRLT